MEQWSYGEMIAARQLEARLVAARERRAQGPSDQRSSMTSLRGAAGRLLVSACVRIAGCARRARGEVNPTVKLLRGTQTRGRRLPCSRRAYTPSA